MITGELWGVSCEYQTKPTLFFFTHNGLPLFFSYGLWHTYRSLRLLMEYIPGRMGMLYQAGLIFPVHRIRFKECIIILCINCVLVANVCYPYLWSQSNCRMLGTSTVCCLLYLERSVTGFTFWLSFFREIGLTNPLPFHHICNAKNVQTRLSLQQSHCVYYAVLLVYSFIMLITH